MQTFNFCVPGANFFSQLATVLCHKIWNLDFGTWTLELGTCFFLLRGTQPTVCRGDTQLNWRLLGLAYTITIDGLRNASAATV